jgi:hypothetical protein
MDVNGRLMNTFEDFGHLRRSGYFEEILADSWTFEDILYFTDICRHFGHLRTFLMFVDIFCKFRTF